MTMLWRDAFASGPWMVAQDILLVIDGYWIPWVAPGCGLKRGTGPRRCGFTEWKSVLWITSPGRVDAFWGRGLLVGMRPPAQPVRVCYPARPKTKKIGPPGVDEPRPREASPFGQPAGCRSSRFPSGKMLRSRIGCTVCQYAEPQKKKKSLRVVLPHRLLLMREASCCWTTERCCARQF